MRRFEPLAPEVEAVAREVVDAAYRVHKALGPGLLESVYDAGLRLDLLVRESVIVEIKASEKMHPLYKAQILTYLKLTGIRLGLLINFNVPLIKDGIKRVIL
jgi:hypothetical protein